MKKNKFKVFLMKVYKFSCTIGILSFIVAFVFLIAAVIIDAFIPFNQEKVMDTFETYWMMMIIPLGGIVILLTYYLEGEELYTPKKMKPDEFKLKDCKNFLTSYQKELESKNFKSYNYSYPTFNISFWVKQDPEIDIVHMFIDVKELTEEIYINYRRDGFEELWFYISDSVLVDFQNKHTKSFLFIKTEKSNIVFEEYINTPPLNAYIMSRVVVGIDAEKEKIYFPNKKDGMAAKLYMEDKKNLEESMKKYFE